MRIAYIFRAKNPVFFSIERVFDLVIQSLPGNLKFDILEVPSAGFSFKNLRYLLKQKRLAARDTIFHITGDIHYCVFAFPGKRTVLTIHDCVFLSQHKGWKRWVLKKILLDWPVSHLKYISTISEKSKQEIIQLTQCNPAKIKVIPNPVSADIYYNAKDFNKDCPVILFIGSTPNKNLERAAAAIQIIPCLLIIIGRLSEKQVLMLNSMAISYTVYSGLTDMQVADQYAAADIILFPSLYEGFGLPVIEGFKAGRVVITSDISPMKETAGNAACLADPYNINSIRENILKVISDDAYRNMLVERGFEQVKKFDTSEIAKEYVSLYNKMLQPLCAE